MSIHESDNSLSPVGLFSDLAVRRLIPCYALSPERSASAGTLPPERLSAEQGNLGRKGAVKTRESGQPNASRLWTAHWRSLSSARRECAASSGVRSGDERAKVRGKTTAEAWIGGFFFKAWTSWCCRFQIYCTGDSFNSLKFQGTNSEKLCILFNVLLKATFLGILSFWWNRNYFFLKQII